MVAAGGILSRKDSPILVGLIVILPYFNAISVDFYAVKCLNYTYFV